MKLARSKRSRQRPLASESLESRIVLTAASAAEYSPLDSFESADELRDYLLAQYRDTFEDLTRGDHCRPRFYDELVAVDLAFNVSADFAALQATAVPRHSDTNVQIAGVDEADLVETDGQYIYSLSGSELVIVDSWPLDDLRVVSRTDLGGNAHAMFLHGDRLTVIAGGIGDAQTGRFDVITLDVTDRSAPMVISSTGIEGTYRNARMIDGKVYLQSSHLARMPAPEYELVDSTEESEFTVFPIGQRPLTSADAIYWPGNCGERDYETWDEYVDRVSDDLLEQMLPDFQSLDAGGDIIGEGVLTAPIDVHLGNSIDGIGQRSGMQLLTVIDAAADTPSLQHSSAVFGDEHSLMFATGDSIVFATEDSRSLGTLYKIDLDGENAPHWSAYGELNGYVYDQFSIDIHNGYLRVATSATISRGQTNSSLYVFQQQGDSLEVVGSLEDFVTGESVFGVRFQGDLAYAITANINYDPLFSFDLSDPTNPEIIDHLEMPGFSRYLHSASDDFLIGVGVDNGRLVSASPRLSLFSTSDPRDLSIADEVVLTPSFLEEFYELHGAEGSRQFAATEFDTDHHAFNYDVESGLLTIPLTNHLYRSDMTTDLMVFRVDTNGGTLETLGVIQHEGDIERSVFIDGKIYSISAETLKVHHPDAIDDAIASLNFRSDPIDVNHDGKVAISDMLTIVAELRHMRAEGEGANIRSALNRPAFDVDSDGTVTVGDAMFIANTIRAQISRVGIGNGFTTGPRPAITLPFDSRNLLGSRTIDLDRDRIWLNTPVAVDLAVDFAVDALLAESS